MTDMELLDPIASAPAPFAAALACLTDADVRHALLRDEPDALDTSRELDLLVHPADRHLLFAALGRAGFIRKLDRRLYRKWLFVRWVEDRFLCLDVHAAFVQSGVRYMNARLALSRLDRTGLLPQLGAEDRFLHIVLHNLLGKTALQPKHVPLLRALQQRGLDRRRIQEQARPFGLESIADRACDELETIIGDPQAWAELRSEARIALAWRPENWLGACQHRFGHRLRPRLRRRSVVVALLGPDGCGKTAFADALQALLDGTPLRAGRVYMGCWGHDTLPMRLVRRLVPPQVSHLRMFAARCGRQVVLSPAEREHLAQHPGRVRLAAAALRYGLKSVLFHAGLVCELGSRYLRHVRLSRRPIVIADRWVYDLEFRQGKVPFVHGQRARARFYRRFPAPDGIVYLEAPYDLVARRKPQLDRDQFTTMDRVFRAVLQAHKPLVMASDGPPDALARRFLTQHWETLIERCNRRA